MVLDLIIRGAESGYSHTMHLAAVLPEYGECRVILLGEWESDGSMVAETISDPEALAHVLREPTDVPVLIYGNEDLLLLAQHMETGTIWITLGAEAHGVREVWRLRQQHNWLSSKQIGLVIEQAANATPPDLERLLRLSRASKAVTVSQDLMAPAESAEPMIDEVPVAVATMNAEEPDPEPVHEDSAVSLQIEATEVEVVMQKEGASIKMTETTVPYRTAETSTSPGNTEAEQAVLQRYTLVRQRRAATTRRNQLEEAMQGLLREIFVSRFVSGPDAAAAFEQLARKLSETSVDFTQVTRSLAEIEERLSALAWVKDEMEI